MGLTVPPKYGDRLQIARPNIRCIFLGRRMATLSPRTHHTPTFLLISFNRWNSGLVE